MFRRMNKKGMSISIVVLVLSTIVLCTLTLFLFNSRLDRIAGSFVGLGEVYEREEVIDFYINDIMEKAVAGGVGLEEEFIESFKDELNKYKVDGSFVPAELEQIEEQVSDENIKLKEGKVIMDLEISIDKILVDGTGVNYVYKKKFEKALV